MCTIPFAHHNHKSLQIQQNARLSIISNSAVKFIKKKKKQQLLNYNFCSIQEKIVIFLPALIIFGKNRKLFLPIGEKERILRFKCQEN